MKSLLYLSVLAFSLQSCGSPPASEELLQSPSDIEYLKKGIVVLHNTRPAHPPGAIGTGSLIRLPDNSLGILTVKHLFERDTDGDNFDDVVEPLGTEVRVRFKGDKNYRSKAKLIGLPTNKDADIAILRLMPQALPKGIHVLPLGKGSDGTKEHAPVSVIGYGHRANDEPTYRTGTLMYVTSFRLIAIGTTVAAIPGDSGGPVLDAVGKIIGVVMGMDFGPSGGLNASRATHVWEVHKLLGEIFK